MNKDAGDERMKIRTQGRGRGWWQGRGRGRWKGKRRDEEKDEVEDEDDEKDEDERFVAARLCLCVALRWGTKITLSKPKCTTSCARPHSHRCWIFTQLHLSWGNATSFIKIIEVRQIEILKHYIRHMHHFPSMFVRKPLFLRYCY